MATSNVDLITDFNAGDDTIRLDNAIFTQLTATGTLSAAMFVSSASGKAMDGNDRVLYNTTTGALSYDKDESGSSIAVKFAELDPHLALTNQEFFVV